MKKLVLILLFLASMVSAIEIPTIPSNTFVYDEAGIMSANQVYQFNSIAADLAKNARFGISVATFKSIDGEDPVEFSLKLAQKWAICSKDSNEGVLIYVVMDPHYRGVQVGYGSEGYLPDVLVERMQEVSLVPALQNGEGGVGIIKLASMIAQKVQEEKEITLSATLDTTQIAPAEKGPNLTDTQNTLIVIGVIVVCAILGLIEAVTGIPLLSFLLVILSCLGKGDGSSGGRSGFGGGGFGGGGSHGGW